MSNQRNRGGSDRDMRRGDQNDDVRRGNRQSNDDMERTAGQGGSSSRGRRGSMNMPGSQSRSRKKK